MQVSTFLRSTQGMYVMTTKPTGGREGVREERYLDIHTTYLYVGRYLKERERERAGECE